MSNESTALSQREENKSLLQEEKAENIRNNNCQHQTTFQRGRPSWAQLLPAPSLPVQQTLRTDSFTSALLDDFPGNCVCKGDEKWAAANHGRDRGNRMPAKPRPGLYVIVISSNASPDKESVDPLQPGCPSGPSPVGWWETVYSPKVGWKSHAWRYPSPFIHLHNLLCMLKDFPRFILHSAFQ